MDYRVSRNAGRRWTDKYSMYDIALVMDVSGTPKLYAAVARAEQLSPNLSGVLDVPFSALGLSWGSLHQEENFVTFAVGLQSSLVDAMVTGDTSFKPIEFLKFFAPLVIKKERNADLKDTLSARFRLWFVHDTGLSGSSDNFIVNLPPSTWETAYSTATLAALAGVSLSTTRSIQDPLRNFYKGVTDASRLYYDQKFFFEFYAGAAAWRTLRSSDYAGVITGPIRKKPTVFWHCGMDDVNTSFIVTCGAGDEYMDDSEFSSENIPANRVAYYRMSAPYTKGKDLGITKSFVNECPYTQDTMFARGWAKRGDIEKWVTKQFGASHGWYKYFCHTLQADHGMSSDDIQKWTTGTMIRTTQDSRAVFNVARSLGIAVVTQHAAFARSVVGAAAWNDQFRPGNPCIFAKWEAIHAHCDVQTSSSTAHTNYTTPMIAQSDYIGLAQLYGTQLATVHVADDPVVPTEEEAAETKVPKKIVSTRALDLVYQVSGGSFGVVVAWWEALPPALEVFTQFEYKRGCLPHLEGPAHFAMREQNPCHYQDVSVSGYGGGWDKTDGTFATQNKNIYVTGLEFDVTSSDKLYSLWTNLPDRLPARMYTDGLVWDGDIAPLARVIPVSTADTKYCGAGDIGYGMPVVFTADNNDGTSRAELEGRSSTQHYQWRLTLIF